MAIRVVLADDHRIMREGLRALLERESDVEVVAEADNGRTAVELAHAKMPDVIVMDLSMPDLNGIEATRQIVGGEVDVRVLALSMHSDRRFLDGALKAGASGYLLKDCALDELVRAIRVVVAGQVYLSPKIASAVVEGYMSNSASAMEFTGERCLTAREREVLQLVAEGRSAKEVACTLSVSVKTVETHRQQIMSKLGLFSVAELTKYAVREGFTSLES